MYKVESVKPAGGDWWEIRIAAPNETSIPMRQMRPGTTEAEMLARAEHWCQVRNEELGLSQKICNRQGADGPYRRRQWTMLSVRAR